MMKAGPMMTRAAVMLGVALLAMPAGAAELAGSEWRPVAVGDASWDDSEAFVRFAGDGRIEGHSGCNRFMGSFALTGYLIEIGPLAATEMMCPAPLLALEQALLDALGGARRYVRERTELTLIGSDGRSASFQQTDWD
jgi:heat shock protein HslJ